MPPGANTADDPAPSEEDAPILAIERFAAMSADIESGTARDEVIAREGLTVEAWTRAQESWLGKMADEAGRKRFELTNRYNAAFVAQRRSLDGGRRGSKKKVAPAQVAPAPPPIAASRSVVAPAPFVAASPSFASPPPFVAAPPPLMSAPPPVAVPAPFFATPPPVVTPSFVAPSSVVIHTPPPAAARPTDLNGTVAADVISPFAMGAPLPFQKGRAAIADAPPGPAKPPAHRIDRGTTSFTSPIAKDAIPFAPAAEPRAALPPTAPMPPLPAPPAGDIDLNGTVTVDAPSPIALRAKLPFREVSDSGSRPPPTTASGLKNLPFRAATPAPAAPAAPRATRFTLEQFASLSAEIAVAPPAVAQVRGRYGLDEASHRAEAEEWGRRFAADKELFARYGALFQSYRDWLARSGR
jgi:hypothetical protein